jgi:hypothetical protein
MKSSPRLFLPIVLLGLILSACGASGVTDISAILDSGPTPVDITATSARIVAITSIDVVCSVAYGTTEEYGGLATDLDMAAGGHSDHGPVLTGLEPDTLYHYQLGGMGADGTVYRSENMTFRTPPADTAETQTPTDRNLALLSEGTRLVGTSSNFGGAENSGTWGGNSAVDGDPTTQWSSDGDGDDAWIEVELEEETHITRVGFWTRTMVTSAQIIRFQVVAGDGTVAGPFELDGASSVHYFETDFSARRLRFEVVKSTGGNTGAVEIEVYGEPSR